MQATGSEVTRKRHFEAKSLDCRTLGSNGEYGMDINSQISVAGRRCLVGSAVERIFKQNKPTHVFVAAARVGDIHASLGFPVDFLEKISEFKPM
jgi:hypothetical protein